LSEREDAEALIGAAYMAQQADDDGSVIASSLTKQRAEIIGK
jgi:hypothetical protein